MIESRNKYKPIYPIMNEENKNQNNNISPPPINLSIKNQKIFESLTPKINIMNKTTSESLYLKK